MGTQIQSSQHGNTVTISVSGRFDFSLHSDFRKAYVDHVSPGVAVVVDMMNVDYMDSSALGMLLLLREHAGNDAAEIKLVNMSGDTREIMKVANFEKLFRVV